MTIDLNHSKGYIKRVIGGLRALHEIHKNTDHNKDIADDIKAMITALELAVISLETKGRVSVIEWHPMTEKPKDESVIIVKYHNGFIASGVVYHDEGGWGCYGLTKNQTKEWAYMPK